MKKYLCFVLFVFVSNSILKAQKTTYYLHGLDTVATKANANEVVVVDRAKQKGYDKAIRYYYKNDSLKREEFYVDTMKVLTWKSYYETGQLKEEFIWVKNNIQQLKTYWPKGSLKRDETYEQNKMIEGKCFTASGKEMTFYPYEVMPEFPGGEVRLNKYLLSNIKVPKAFLENGTSGKVIIQFVIDETGKIFEPKIAQHHMDETDAEALRVIRAMPLWKPGKQDGIPVKVSYRLPIDFSIQE